MLFRSNVFDGGDPVVRFKVEWDTSPEFNSLVNPSTGAHGFAGRVELDVTAGSNPRDIRSYIIPDAPRQGNGVRYPAEDAES